MKDWKPFNDECTRCGGSDVRVLTDATQDGYAYDGDDAECLECGLLGSVCIDGDENDNGEATAHVSWDDYDE
jgi:hypothetical protein